MKETKDKMRSFNRFLTAIMSDNLSKFKEYIYQCDPKDLKYVNDKNENLLFYATHYAKKHRVEMITELLKNDININQRNKNNQTVLLKVAQEDYIDFKLAKVLLDNGANINAKNKDADNFVLYIFSNPINYRRHRDELLWLIDPKYNLDVKALNNQNKSIIHYILSLASDEKFNLKVIEEIIKHHDINFLPSKAQPIILSLMTKSPTFELFELFEKTSLLNKDNVEYFLSHVEKNKAFHHIKDYPVYKELEKKLISYEKDKIESSLLVQDIPQEKTKKLKL